MSSETNKNYFATLVALCGTFGPIILAIAFGDEEKVDLIVLVVVAIFGLVASAIVMDKASMEASRMAAYAGGFLLAMSATFFYVRYDEAGLLVSAISFGFSATWLLKLYTLYSRGELDY